MRAVSSDTTRFSGSVPELYERHLGPVLFEPYARDLARRVPAAAQSVLEIAAGTGRLTRQLLAALPDSEVVATDLNAAMLEEARRQIGDTRVQWRTADVQALPFEPASYDAVACQFGLMFVPDKALAMREMRRVLAPHGTLLVNAWDAIERNAAQCLVHQLACEQFPDDPPRFLETPFAMPRPDELVALARAAGFAAAHVQTVAQVAVADDAADFTTGLVRGTPLWHQLVERGVDAADFEARVSARLVGQFGDKPCRSPLSAHVLIAVA
jgi:ubiquinone/menaquinone biosynthesis C-methylase UbiE